MRNLVKITLLLMLTAGLSSCEKIKSIFDVEFDTTLSGDLDIDIQESATKSTNNYEFEKWVDVDPLDDDDIAEYKDNIKDFDVNTVLVEVLDVNKENVVFVTGTTFTIADKNNTVSWTMETDWAIEKGTKITLGDASGIYKAVGEILTKKEKFRVGAKGVSTETGVLITLRIGIDTKVTASPL